MDIEKLINEYPNNMELGEAIRKLYFEGKESMDEFLKKYKDAKIFESPDGGKTIYVRGFGEPFTNRKIVKDKSQLSIFPDEVGYRDKYFKSNYNTTNDVN